MDRRCTRFPPNPVTEREELRMSIVPARLAVATPPALYLGRDESLILLPTTPQRPPFRSKSSAVMGPYSSWPRGEPASLDGAE